MADLILSVQEEKKSLREEIQREDASQLHDSRREPLLVQDLVAQYLSHDGFIETARAFAQEMRHNNRLLNGDEGIARGPEYKEDLDAIHRQRKKHREGPGCF